MITILKTISYAALVITLVPAFLVYAGIMSFESYKYWVLAGTLVWFATAPFWINKKMNNQ